MKHMNKIPANFPIEIQKINFLVQKAILAGSSCWLKGFREILNKKEMSKFKGGRAIFKTSPELKPVPNSNIDIKFNISPSFYPEKLGYFDEWDLLPQFLNSYKRLLPSFHCPSEVYPKVK